MMDIKIITVTNHSLSHPWLHKIVLIGGDHAWKGKQGEVLSHIPAHNSFTVWVHGAGYISCKASVLSLL